MPSETIHLVCRPGEPIVALLHIKRVIRIRKGRPRVEWRWYVRHNNGKKLSNSGESYQNKDFARVMAHRMNQNGYYNWKMVVDA
jgi:hypothetical protein